MALSLLLLAWLGRWWLGWHLGALASVCPSGLCILAWECAGCQQMTHRLTSEAPPGLLTFALAGSMVRGRALGAALFSRKLLNAAYSPANPELFKAG